MHGRIPEFFRMEHFLKNIQKKCSNKIQECGKYSKIFAKMLTNLALYFRRLDEQRDIQESFEKIFKFSITFHKKIAKSELFQHIFQKNLTNPA